jgi:hypothetical protein
MHGEQTQRPQLERTCCMDPMLALLYVTSSTLNSGFCLRLFCCFLCSNRKEKTLEHHAAQKAVQTSSEAESSKNEGRWLELKWCPEAAQMRQELLLQSTRRKISVGSFVWDPAMLEMIHDGTAVQVPERHQHGFKYWQCSSTLDCQPK